jgi:O-antigen/teichoic acid export membrane protein
MAVLAGAVRNVRVHFADQVVMLFESTRLNIVINTVEAVATIVFCIVGVELGGLPGAAAGCLAGATIGTLFGFGLGIVRFGLIVPWADFGRITLAAAFMAAVLAALPFARLDDHLVVRMLIESVFGGLLYAVVLAALYPAIVREGLRWLRSPRSVTL